MINFKNFFRVINIKSNFIKVLVIFFYFSEFFKFLIFFSSRSFLISRGLTCELLLSSAHLHG